MRTREIKRKPSAEIGHLYKIVDSCLYRYRHFDGDTLDDLFQEGLIAAWRTSQKYGPDAKKALLYRSAEYGMINWLRKFGRLVPGRPRYDARKERPLPVMVPLEEWTAVEPAGFDTRLEQRDTLTRLVGRLSPRDRTILEGQGHRMPPDEIAIGIGKSEDYVKSRKKVVIQKLKKIAKEMWL